MRENNEISAGCIYHSKTWRSKFQFLSNQLVGKIIRPGHRRYLHLACTCKEKNAAHFAPYTGMKYKYPNLVTYFNDVMSKNPSLWRPDETSPLMCLEDAFLELLHSTSKESKESRWRFLLIVYLSLEKEFTMFSSNEQSQQKADSWHGHSYRYEDIIYIKFDGRHIGPLIGKNGCNLEKIRRANNCEIRVMDSDFEEKMRGLYRGRFRNFRDHRHRNKISAKVLDMKVLIRSQDPRDKENAQAQLEQLMSRVLKKRERHDENVKLFQEKRNLHLRRVVANRLARHKCCIEHDDSRLGDVRTRKATMSADYSKKAWQKQKQYNAKRQKQKANEEKSSLVGGHCKMCQSPFKTVHSMHDTPCRFHPGYLVNVRKDHPFLITTPPANPANETASSDSADDEILAKLAEGVTIDADLIPSLSESAPSSSEPQANMNAHYKNHKHHHKPIKISSKENKVELRKRNDVVHKGGSKDFLNSHTDNEENNDISAQSKNRDSWPTTEDSDLEDDGFQGGEIESPGSTRDRGSTGLLHSVCADDIEDWLERKKIVQKWSCCNLMMFDVPNGTRLEEGLKYNHAYAGCCIGKHVFVPLKKKRGRKCRATNNSNLLIED